MIKKYTTGNSTVVWDHEKCIHSANCVRGLPNVFKPKEKPWIQTEHATEAEVVEQVGKCPSGALSISKE